MDGEPSFSGGPRLLDLFRILRFLLGSGPEYGVRVVVVQAEGNAHREDRLNAAPKKLGFLE